MALIEDLAGLPTAYEDGKLPAKQFDLLILNAQLELLRQQGGFTRFQDRIVKFASRLEELSNVPLVTKELELILEIQTEAYWEDVTPEMLESVRRRLRHLAELIKPTERKIVITDFGDDIGEGNPITMPEVGSGVDKARFKMKVRRFIEQHQDHITLIKVRRGEALTKQDLDELERILIEQEVADDALISDLAGEGGLGRFLRSLTGLDRAAAKHAFSTFVSKNQLNADQAEFLDMVVDSLTESGFVDPVSFYESPFTDLDDMGIAGIFSRDQAQEIIQIVRELNDAVAA